MVLIPLSATDKRSAPSDEFALSVIGQTREPRRYSGDRDALSALRIAGASDILQSMGCDADTSPLVFPYRQPRQRGGLLRNMMIVCLALGAAASVAALSVAAAIGAVPSAATAAGQAGPKYLLFQAWTYNPPPRVLPAGAAAGLQQRDALRQGISTLRTRIGAQGDGVTTQLGFVTGPIVWDETDAQMRQQIDDAFAVAEETNLAVGFHIDDSMFWGNRQDLLRDRNNVEWSNWERSVVPHRIVGWFAQGAPDLAPPMCYTSPAIKKEAVRLARDVVGAEIKKGVDRLNASGKGYLFAGVIAGWETRMQDDSFNPSSSSDRFYGYCALHNLGYSADRPPADLAAALEAVVHDWIVLWTRSLESAGIPRDKIFTHVAFPAQSPPAELPQRFKMGVFKNVDPNTTAFNEHSLPGFSVYGTFYFRPASTLMKALRARPGIRWGVAEGTALDFENTGEGMERYLAGVFNHGGAYANLFGFWDGEHSPLGRSTASAAAIDAYRKFLRGEPLRE
jgi:hypothetical protein